MTYLLGHDERNIIRHQIPLIDIRQKLSESPRHYVPVPLFISVRSACPDPLRLSVLTITQPLQRPLIPDMFPILLSHGLGEPSKVIVRVFLAVAVYAGVGVEAEAIEWGRGWVSGV